MYFKLFLNILGLIHAVTFLLHFVLRFCISAEQFEYYSTVDSFERTELQQFKLACPDSEILKKN